jgi:hypothetical protein
VGGSGERQQPRARSGGGGARARSGSGGSDGGGGGQDAAGPEQPASALGARHRPTRGARGVHVVRRELPAGGPGCSGLLGREFP